MANEDQSLEILIKTLADMHGADAVRNALAGVKAETVSGAAATGKATEASREAARAAKKLGGEHEVLRKLLHLTSQQYPILGAAVRAFFSPMGAALTAAIFAWRTLTQKIKETNAALDEIGKAAAKPFGDVKESAFEARDAVAENKRAWTEWREGIENAMGKEKEAFDLQRTLLNEQLELTNKLIEARVKAGVITPEQAVGAKSAAAAAGAQAQVGLLEAQRLKLSTQLYPLGKQVEEMAKRETDVRRQTDEIARGKRAEAIKAEIEAARKAEEEAKKKYESLEGAAPAARALRLMNIPRPVGAAPDYEKEVLAPARAEMEATAKRRTTLEDQNRVALQSQTQALKDLEAAQKKAKEEYAKLVEAIDALTQQITAAQGKAAVGTQHPPGPVAGTFRLPGLPFPVGIRGPGESPKEELDRLATMAILRDKAKDAAKEAEQLGREVAGQIERTGSFARATYDELIRARATLADLERRMTNLEGTARNARNNK